MLSQLLNEYKNDRGNKRAADKLLQHMTNRACRQHLTSSTKSVGELKPSDHLCVMMSDDQRKGLNPSMTDLLLTRVEEDAFGEGTKKKRARRRQDFYDGNAKSYSRI
jgi:hypothetical protein